MRQLLAADQVVIYTLSLGVASTVSDNNSSTMMLVAIADEALYPAKKQGRDRVFMFGEI